MIVYFEYAVTWLFFMAIIVGLCLITPKLAKKIDQWREAKKNRKDLLETQVSDNDEKQKSD